MSFLSIALLLQMASVQNWAIDKVTNYLNKDSQFTTSIGHIDLNWWDALSLSNLEIKDHHDSTMIAAQKAMVDFQLGSLIGSGTPSLDNVRLEESNVQLITHEGDSTMNINLWATELSKLFGSSGSSGSSSFGIGQIEIRNSKFALVNYNSEPITDGLDYNRMRFVNLAASASDFLIEGSEIQINIGLLSGLESGSGLNIKELKTDLTFAPEFLEFDKLNLITNKSHIKDFLRFEYASTSSFSDFLTKVVIIANMEETILSLDDLRFFAPTLPNINDEIILTGAVKGPVSDLRSEEFLLRIGKKTEIFGAFRLDGLPDIEDTYINLSLQNSTLNATDLAPYLSDNIQEEILKFGTIRLNADFAGYLSRFDTNGQFQTSIGDIDGRVNFEQKNGSNKVVSNVTIKELDLGKITNSPDVFQKVSLEGNVNLEGKSRDDILIGLDAVISKIGVKGYNYSNIQTDANYGLDLFEGHLAINDPNLKLNGRGTINLRDTSEAININVQLDTANLTTLNLSEKATFVSGELQMDTKGINVDDLTGIMRVKDLAIGYDGRFLEVGDFYFQSLFAGGTRTMSLNSDYLVAGASGHFAIEQMMKDFPVLYNQYLAILFKQEQPVADIEEYFNQEYKIDLNIRLLDINPIVQLFQPDYYISKNTLLEGAFYQTAENTIFNFFTSIDTLQYQSNVARDVNIDFNTSKLINSEDILASFYIFSKNQNLGTSLEFSNFGFEAIWNNDALNLDFALDQDSTQSSARIKAEARFSPDQTALSFEPSQLIVLGNEWKFDPENEILLQSEGISFNNVVLQSKKQVIDIEGVLGNDAEDQLYATILNVNANILNTLTPQEYNGRINGQLILSNAETGSRNIRSEIKVDSLQINEIPIGNLLANAHLNDSTLVLNLENELNGKKTINLGGNLFLADQIFDLNGNLNNAEMAIFEPFLSNYISNLGGTISGKIQLKGNASNPQLLGQGNFNQGRLRVNYLNTPYQLDGGFIFEPGEISFDRLVAKDLNGNTANLSGGLKYQGLEDIVLDINAKLNNFQVLNTSKRDNEVFYGLAFVTGTIDIVGSTSNLDINARATSEANTRIYIPLSSNNDQVSEEYIHFINIQDTVRIQELADEVNRLNIENVRMNFVLDLTPDAYAEIIIDPRTDEKISGRGRGVLTLGIDTQGNFSLSGSYEITQATYDFSLYNVLKKEFQVEPGGRITWYGDPYQGVMNLKAKYTESVSVSPLLATSTTQDQQSSVANRRYPVDVIMNLNGELLSPDITFGFDFSQFPNNGDIQTAISSFQSRIANDEQEMNRQVFSVIMTRSLSPEGQFAGVNTISSSLGQLISSQLNSFIGQMDKNLEVNVDLASLDQNALETFQLSVAYTFLDGRLRVSRDGGFTDNTGNADAASIIGDWQAEYLLTDDGVYRIRIFNRNNFNTFTSLSLSKNVATYGVSVSQNVSFNSFSELFEKITRKKQKADPLYEDSDNYLRYNRDGSENWKPINLDKIEERLDSLKQNKEQFLYLKEEED
ncbi:translocation/assembly module TamB domain-containing protein [Algoriphagus zhangzhouensis]|uniref:translocation/assembly module TamB domain-containing protein n=1 Tax=Algoriphagus zhangzhouensis TaxID=1073327 RepID=UPI001065F770|nr:translocation/assembly module TamB domain-containing protein [Algoriphagus zhangzhouensis]